MFPSDLLSRMADLQSSQPKIRLRLTRVGIKKLKFGIRVSGKSGYLSLFPTVDLFVDLPSDEKGVHLSRNVESLNEILQGQLKSGIHHVENFCEVIARRLLEKHERASTAEVHLRSDYVVSRKPPAGKSVSDEPCEILAMATAARKGGHIDTDRVVGVKVIGITTCPCAQGLLKSLVEERLRKSGYLKNDIEKIISNIPLATHSQRAFGTALIQVPVSYSVDVEDLIDIVEESMSGRTYALLKRPPEALVIEMAHKNAKFTEDVVREILWRLAKKYRNFQDGTRIFANVYSEESVHKHDIVAERVATLGEIRSEMKTK